MAGDTIIARPRTSVRVRVPLRTGDLITVPDGVGAVMRDIVGGGALSTTLGRDGEIMVIREDDPVMIVGFTARDVDGDRWPIVYCLRTQAFGKTWFVGQRDADGARLPVILARADGTVY